MILQGAGLPDSPQDVIRELGHDGVTNETELLNLLIRRGGESRYAGYDWAQLWPHVAVAPNVYLLILIRDNNTANPDMNGRNLHWIACYRENSDGTLQCVNSWPDASGKGRDIAYSPAQLGAAFVWGAAVAFANAAPVSAHQPTGGVPEAALTAKEPTMRYVSSPTPGPPITSPGSARTAPCISTTATTAPERGTATSSGPATSHSPPG